MKKSTICGLYIALVTLVGCSRKPIGSQISYLGQDAAGTVKMSVNGYGNREADIAADAQVKAFEHLLYVGLPDATSTEIKNSDFRLPLVKDRASVEGMPFLQNFFKKNEYLPFVIDLKMLAAKPQRTANKQNTLPFAITVNYDAFRRSMEQHGVIRKFGY